VEGVISSVVVWDLEENRLVKVICDHEDSVFCVRFDEQTGFLLER